VPFKEWIQTTPVFPALNIPRRAVRTFGPYIGPQMAAWAKWLFTSREDTNYTYAVSELSIRNMAHTIASALGRPIAEIAGYFAEAQADAELAQWVREHAATGPRRGRSDLTAHYGRRLPWYAVARAIRPAVIVETGLDKGLGSVLLCTALLRNAAQGAPGRYVGMDTNTGAGELLGGRYAEVGSVIYGDSVQALKELPGSVGLFIGDCHWTADHERAEFAAVLPKLAAGGVILSGAAHVRPSLSEFAEQNGLDFTVLGERPINHWYPGGLIGMAWRAH
jgi:hypothetical protein